jgi:hypothetical protein
MRTKEKQEEQRKKKVIKYSFTRLTSQLNDFDNLLLAVSSSITEFNEIAETMPLSKIYEYYLLKRASEFNANTS